MIRTRKELKFYIQEDSKRNGIPAGWGGHFFQMLFPSENMRIFNYLKCLRHYEYHLNNNSLIHRCLCQFYRLKLRKLGVKYNMLIPPNVCGYGLKIGHLAGGGGVLLNAKSIGNYCGFNSGVLIGNKGGQENCPVIGDYVRFGPGAKAIGRISIGPHVFVAANSVVVKDVPAHSVVGGVPAKFLKQNDNNDN